MQKNRVLFHTFKFFLQRKLEKGVTTFFQIITFNKMDFLFYGRSQKNCKQNGSKKTQDNNQHQSIIILRSNLSVSFDISVKTLEDLKH